jgi:hypothetical protein
MRNIMAIASYWSCHFSKGSFDYDGFAFFVNCGFREGFKHVVGRIF